MKNNSSHLTILCLTILCLTFYNSPFAQVQMGEDIDGEAAEDYSGAVSLSSDGNRVAIGASGNNGSATGSGHVRVYDWSNGNWIQVGGDIDGEAIDDYSGFLISLSSDGSRIAIGARFNDENGSNAGHVRVYDWLNGSWVQVGGDIDGEAAGDYSGAVSLSADGSRVAIGAHGNGNDAGHVRVYDWSNGNWVQVGGDIDGEALEDHSGDKNSVSLSSDGSRIAIGARSNDGNGVNAGHVRVYGWSNGNWVQVGGDIDGEAAGDNSGSVSLSSDGNRVAIGASGNDGNGTGAGHVRVYDWSNGSWVQVGGDIDGEAAGDSSGYSVSLSSDGSRVAIGAAQNDGNGTSAGHVRIYDLLNGNWVQVGEDMDGEAAGDRSSDNSSVSLSSDGSRVAIGAAQNDGNGTSAGHVRVYENFFSIFITENNPACVGAENGSIQIQSSGLAFPFSYTYALTDESGTVIYNNIFESSDFTLTDLVAGDYEFSVVDDGGETSRKFYLDCPAVSLKSLILQRQTVLTASQMAVCSLRRPAAAPIIPIAGQAYLPVTIRLLRRASKSIISNQGFIM